MLRKMRRRFILAAMAAFGTVMAVLLAGINVADYIRSTAMEDHMAQSLLEYERAARRPGMPLPPMDDMPGGGPEAAFTTRFFTVRCDPEGNVQRISRDFISSIDEGEAGKYARAVLSRGRERGYYGDYRYLVSRDGTGATILFLNASNTLQHMRSLFLVSSLTGAASLLVVLVLVLLFSGYAVRPYAENIRRQKRFITDAGHELKTPIASIATSADIAAMEHKGDEWIGNIQRQTARLSKLVGDLVALSRLDEEMPFPEKCIFSLSEAAWETAEPFAVRAKAEGKGYRQKIEEGLELRGDRDSVQRMISILLDNGVRYTDKGGEICLDVYRRRGKICIEVWNACELPDIPDLERLFDRFYRLDGSRSVHTGGTGIGLSMARAIAESHGGRIEAKKTEGGIRFKVVL